MYGLFIERACRAQIEMAGTGWKWSTPADAGYDRKMTGPGPDYHMIFFDYFARRLARAEART